MTSLKKQEAQLSQRDRAMLRVIEHFVKSVKVTRSVGYMKALLVFHRNYRYVCMSFPFLRYSASNNGVTLKPGLEVVQVH